MRVTCRTFCVAQPKHPSTRMGPVLHWPREAEPLALAKNIMHFIPFPVHGSFRSPLAKIGSFTLVNQMARWPQGCRLGSHFISTTASQFPPPTFSGRRPHMGPPPSLRLWDFFLYGSFIRVLFFFSSSGQIVHFVLTFLLISFLSSLHSPTPSPVRRAHSFQ